MTRGEDRRRMAVYIFIIMGITCLIFPLIYPFLFLGPLGLGLLISGIVLIILGVIFKILDFYDV